MAGCGCGTSWTGSRTAHCARCHFTFTSVSGFDEHQSTNYDRDDSVTCKSPLDIGMEVLRTQKAGGSVWGKPIPEDVRARLQEMWRAKSEEDADA